MFFLVFCLLTTFVFSGTLELSDCMIMKSFIQQIILLFYNVDYQTKFKFTCVQFIILASERKEKENIELNNKRKHYAKTDKGN